jgi:hypothetical protein
MLTEQPVFVITLDEVELVHFERVQVSLKLAPRKFLHRPLRVILVVFLAVPLEEFRHGVHFQRVYEKSRTRELHSNDLPGLSERMVKVRTTETS